MAKFNNMKTVISASRRTDIPAFYLPWFMSKIRTGSVDVINPFNRNQVRTVDLSADKVAWIVFWSRNYAPLLMEKDAFAAYQLFFHFTILSPSLMEKAGIPLSRAVHQAQELSRIYGADHITWRYDPVVFWKDGAHIRTNFKADDFRMLCRELSAAGLSRCYTSIAYPYNKFIKRFNEKYPQLELSIPGIEQENAVVSRMVDIASEYEIKVYSCCTERLLSIPGVHPASCIDGALFNRLSKSEKVSVIVRPTRKGCRCTESVDIGDYLNQPCPFGCIYCYANPLWK
ncbi:MAG: DUF1848 family protein [Calditrichaceae bacterium]|nr:DUF1848 family protein [Calditrichaceae bacterium]MBN2708727.1 DUF1848 family protein [Calditrichaceae bacterium]RQV92149.1 MAG: DUF1848 family protein [Calditrichota bacterium]